MTVRKSWAGWFSALVKRGHKRNPLYHCTRCGDTGMSFYFSGKAVHYSCLDDREKRLVDMGL